MKIYYHDGEDDDPRLPHQDDPGILHRDDPRLPHDSGTLTQSALPFMLEHRKQKASANISEDYLEKTLGIICRHWSPFDDVENNAEKKVKELAEDRNYIHSDTIAISRPALGTSYDDKIVTFYEEHMHEDEEIRWIRAGTGYFDVRDARDRWVRISLEEGDLLILPAGLYHRFTVDLNEYIIAERLYQSRTGWTALNRSEETEKNPFRIEYLRQRAKGFK